MTLKSANHGFIVTSSRNVIGRGAKLYKTESIVVDGYSVIADNVMIRADLAPVQIGRYCRIEPGAVLRPPLDDADRGEATFQKQLILDYVVIEKDAIIKATMIHNGSHIMERAIIGERTVIGAGARILPDSVIAPDSVIPPLAIYSGNPAQMIGRLESDHENLFKAQATETYKNILAHARESK